MLAQQSADCSFRVSCFLFCDLPLSRTPIEEIRGVSGHPMFICSPEEHYFEAKTAMKPEARRSPVVMVLFNKDSGFSELLWSGHLGSIICRCTMFLAAVLASFLVVPDDTDEMLYRKVAPSVVAISTSSSKESEPTFSGTGFYVSFGDKGGFVTARHVVEGSVKIVVTINKKSISCDVWSDPKIDCAILKPSKPVTVVGLRFSTKAPVVGQSCWIVGCPSPGQQMFNRVLSKGIINQYPIEDVAKDGLTLGFSCSLVGGQSGSPIVDSSGQVIGIACATYSGTDLSFGVPSVNMPLDSMQKWISK